MLALDGFVSTDGFRAAAEIVVVVWVNEDTIAEEAAESAGCKVDGRVRVDHDEGRSCGSPWNQPMAKDHR